MDMRSLDDDLEEEELEELLLDAPAETYVVAEEFTDFVGHNNMEFITMLTKLWDNMPEYKHPKIHGKSVVIEKPTVNILSGNTAQGFALAFPAEALGNGFLSRILLVHSDPTGLKITFPKPKDKALKAALVEHLREIKVRCHGEAQVSDDAYIKLDQIYQDFHELEDYRFKHYCARRLTHLIKLSLLIACSKVRSCIEAEDVVQANTLLHFTEQRMHKALGEFGKSKLSDQTTRVLELLNEAEKPLTLEDIFKKVGRDFSKVTELGDVLRNLMASGKAQQVQHVGRVCYLPLKQQHAEWKPTLLDESFLTHEEKLL